MSDMIEELKAVKEELALLREEQAKMANDIKNVLQVITSAQKTTADTPVPEYTVITGHAQPNPLRNG